MNHVGIKTASAIFTVKVAARMVRIGKGLLINSSHAGSSGPSFCVAPLGAPNLIVLTPLPGSRLRRDAFRVGYPLVAPNGARDYYRGA